MTRVLVVEDDYLLVFPIEDCLREAGFEVEIAHNGDEAIKALHRGSFDALLTDIRLGPGPDGWEVAQRAREMSQTIPVIYITADSAIERQANGVPSSTLLAKPFLLDQLVAELARLTSVARVAA